MLQMLETTCLSTQTITPMKSANRTRWKYIPLLQIFFIYRIDKLIFMI